MNVVFMGTPEIAANVLKTLFSLENANVVCVVCQPDRMLDRKKNFVFSPVKQFCLDNEIICFQPEKISEIYEKLKTLNIDIIVTCAYGQFIPDKILELPKIGAFNIHASLLPKLRGGAPIHWAIINGFHETGITIMKMVKKMDAGDILWQAKCKIDNNETTKSLTVKLTNLSCTLLSEKWKYLINNNFKSTPQNENDVSFGLNIKKEETFLNFNQKVQEIDRWIRGLYDKPLAIWNYKNINIKVYEAEMTKIKSSVVPGEITKIDKSGLYISTLDYDLKILKLQLPNKKPLNVYEIINGNHPFIKNEKI